MRANFDPQQHTKTLVPLLKLIEKSLITGHSELAQICKKYTKSNGDVYSKEELVRAYRHFAGTHGLAEYSDQFLQKIHMKPMRTASGVTPITVLTKPFPCPGKCIFCPNDVRMPKSYLSDEPGAQRAERNFFDPYLQTYNRLQALHNIGHSVEKCEVIILGGTWSYYPESYQIWFVTRCFEALNDFGGSHDRPKRSQKTEIQQHYTKISQKLRNISAHIPSSDPAENKHNLQKMTIDGATLEKSYNQVVSETYTAPEKRAGLDVYQSGTWSTLEEEQRINERAHSKCIGLVIETRPDTISQQEIRRIRKLGCTKTQIGFQSLQDSVLKLNKRGHSVAATRRAVTLLRQAGFKIHAHWMANLYGSSVELDKSDFLTLFSDPDFMPDELKIYPCSLINSAELMQYYLDGRWQPYSHEQLLEILTFCLEHTPAYCRLSRIIRDIPSTDIVDGNKKTNFRQIAQDSLRNAGKYSRDIRAREIKDQEVSQEDLNFSIEQYQTATATEYFLQYTTPAKNPKMPDKIVAFLRLSLPTTQSWLSELQESALIREIHVYGRVVGIGQTKSGKAQHFGLGTQLIEQARQISQANNFTKLSVISAVGTRPYYRNRGFFDGELYQHMILNS